MILAAPIRGRFFRHKKTRRFATSGRNQPSLLGMLCAHYSKGGGRVTPIFYGVGLQLKLYALPPIFADVVPLTVFTRTKSPSGIWATKTPGAI